MNDSEMLVWIAEHLLYFRPGLGVSTMTYIADDGMTKEIEYTSDECNPPCVAMLRGCVAEATKK